MATHSTPFTVRSSLPRALYPESPGEFPRKLYQRQLTALAKNSIGAELQEKMIAALKEMKLDHLTDKLGDFVKVVVGRGFVFEADYDTHDQTISNVEPVTLGELFKRSFVGVLAVTVHGERYEATEAYDAGVSFKIDKMLIERPPTTDVPDFGFKRKVKTGPRNPQYDNVAKIPKGSRAGKAQKSPPYSVYDIENQAGLNP